MADLYSEASGLITQILKAKGHGIKSILFNKSKTQNHNSSSSSSSMKSQQRSPAVIALVLETLKCMFIIFII